MQERCTIRRCVEGIMLPMGVMTESPRFRCSPRISSCPFGHGLTKVQVHPRLTTTHIQVVCDNVQIAFGAMNVDGASVTASEADPGLKCSHRAIVEAYWHTPYLRYLRKYLKYLVSLFPHRVVPCEPGSPAGRSRGPASGWQVPPENFMGAVPGLTRPSEPSSGA
jgi:hypothetical protein